MHERGGLDKRNSNRKAGMNTEKLTTWLSYIVSHRDPVVREVAIERLRSRLDDEGKEFVLEALRLRLQAAQTDKAVVEENILNLKDEIADLEGGTG